jgi:O-glycosyl hydrolase
MKTKFFYAAILIFLLAAIETLNAQVNISVNQNIRYQVIDGFGATTLPLVHGTKDYIAPYRDSAIAMLYRDVKLNMGNLSCGTFEAPTGSGGPSANDNDNPYIANPKGFDWQYVINQKKKIIDKGSPYGFNDWYPEPKITTRWDWSGKWLRDLKSIDYNTYIAECAEHIVEALKYFRDSLGIVRPYVMPFNEALSGNKELYNGTYREIKDILIAIGQRMNMEGFTNTKLLIGNEETTAENYNLLSFLLADTAVSKYVGAIGYHTYPYGSAYASINNILDNSGQGQPVQSEINIRQNLNNLAKQYGVKLWMTEVSNGWIGGQSGNLSIDSIFSMLHVRGRAIHIHDEFLYARANAYFGMNALWDYNSHVEHFGTGSNFYMEDGTFVLVDQRDSSIKLTGMARAVGHYSRWITPGKTRCTEAVSSDSLVMVTSMIDTATNNTILVVINNKNSNEIINVNMQLPIIGTISGELSYGSFRWQSITPFAATGNNTFSYTLPGQSVATFVISNRVPSTTSNISNPDIVVYPNPVNNQLTITFPIINSDNLKLEIFNTLSQIIATQKIDGNLGATTIDISQFREGIYFIRLTLNNQTFYCKKIIITR